DGRAVATWQEMSDAIGASGGAPLKMEILRKASPEDPGAVLQVELVPVQSQRKTIFGETETAWLIGIRSSGAFETHELSLVESFGAGFRQCWSMISLTWQGFVKLVERVVPADQVGGPIMIAQIIGQQAEQGLAGLLGLAALISINLGILNLLPIPVLDGGTVVFCLLEIIFRRPVSKKLVGISMRIGIALLLALMVFATYNDVVRIFKG
ncbi:MAG: site-2 protease family protein, partial [Desulfovibrio sp.]|nr:site-2 protease family protein [Desulfovibrio sp.]